MLPFGEMTFVETPGNRHNAPTTKYEHLTKSVIIMRTQIIKSNRLMKIMEDGHIFPLNETRLTLLNVFFIIIFILSKY